VSILSIIAAVLLFFFAGVPLAVVILYPLYLLGFTAGKAGIGLSRLRRR
jgi:hypothetical protein